MISGTEMIAAADRVMARAMAEPKSVAEELREEGFEADSLWLLAIHMVQGGALPTEIQDDDDVQRIAAQGFIAGFRMALDIREELGLA